MTDLEQPLHGQATRAWVARCARCGQLGVAVAWGQREGFAILRSHQWSKKTDGWTCPDCAQSAQSLRLPA
jgi:hypothetical protein